MRIVHIIWALPIGGAESLLIDIINEQGKTNEVSLIIINKLIDDELIKKIAASVKVYKIRRPIKSRKLIYILYLNIILLILRPDFIHCHNHNLIQIINPLYYKKTGLTVHDVNIECDNFRKYGKLFSISKSVQNDILNRAKLRSVLIYNGINAEKINNIVKTKKDQIALDKTYKIIQVSRLEHEKKGQDILIQAVNELINNYSLKEVTVDLVGDGKSFKYLEHMIEELKLCEYINLMGAKSREFIYDNLCNYDLLVQPSNFEGFGLTVVEAMAAGIPVLVSNIDGPMEIIEGGKYGYFFERGNSSNLADQIRQLIMERNNPEYEQKLLLASSYVQKEFSVEKVYKKYLNEYII